MKIILNLTTSFDLNGDFEKQIDNLEKLKKHLDKDEPVYENSEIGEMEKLYLKVTGKTRMNHMDKSLSREQQALLNLKNLGVSLQEKEETLEESFSYVMSPSEEEIEEKSHDPFC